MGLFCIYKFLKIGIETLLKNLIESVDKLLFSDLYHILLKTNLTRFLNLFFANILIP
jgi:hypothetical protein